MEGKNGDSLRLLREIASRTDISDYYLGLALYYNGQSAEAEQLLSRMSGGETRNVRAAAALASILAATGKRSEASKMAARIAVQSTIDHHIAYSLGAAYAQLGDATQSVRWLDESIRIGFPCYPWFARDPLLQPIRPDPRFIALMDKLRSEHEIWAKRYGG